MKAADRKRILVTGGAGFLGSHLCEALLRQGHELLCADNFLTGSRRNLLSLLRHPRFRLMRHDVTQPLEVDVDEIYNLACPASPVHYQQDPVRTTRTSVLGTLNLLELARRSGARLLQASTSEVYGDPLQHPQTESYWGNVNPVGVRACYDEGKRCAETLCMDYRRQYGVDAKLVRIFNTYGPRMQADDGRVVSNFVMQALRGAPLTVYGDGMQTRSFCYVEDMVRGLVAMMGTPAGTGGPVNLGNPNECTMLELAQQVIHLCDSVSSVEHRPLPSDDPARRRPDIGLARQLLGWAPEVPLEAGLQRTIGWFRQQWRAAPALAAEHARTRRRDAVFAART
ncbi:UDP-glucuronic acid decarboxylase family protein [Noviherbaspirillum aridicola]|uniref:dTDP-glucose 4,6-dehydratase n=1 Tax=Noviherbaspirillum aridicola TaxID=2849687 RepID=A0ABQ4Q9J8_9BURK|nr:UDP-glucuronic acid decarboxylase family protein [Noviherbaspirillum aridicola]GIZ53747.1 dTDP-glucose 4,6-dehydratase [Noviherbaspirillum aridicola]